MSEYGERIASLEASRENLKNWVSAVQESCQEKDNKLELRVHELEAVMNKAKGGWAIIAGICAGSGVIGGLIAKLIHP